MIYCKDCKHNHRGTETRVNSGFISGDDPDLLAPAFDIYDNGGVRCCQHRQCFNIAVNLNPVNKVTTKTRVRGSAQLNEDGDCPFFKGNLIYRSKLAAIAAFRVIKRGKL